MRTRYGIGPNVKTIAKALSGTKTENKELIESSGPFAGDNEFDPDAAYQSVILAQGNTLDHEQKRNRARIVFSGEKPVAIVFLSDVHFGSYGVDYAQAFADAAIIQETDGMYAVFHGDGIDNFIPGKLQQARRGAPITLDEEWALLARWLAYLKGKLLVAVAGNHDNWTRYLGGVDFLRELLPKTVLYDRHEILVKFVLGSYSWLTLIRHKYRFNSIYNPLHSLKQTVRFHSVAPDIAVGGHVHKGASYEIWWHHGIQRLAILTGTYKLVDEYAKEQGFVNGGGQGGAIAVILTPHGEIQPFTNLTLAARILKSLRKQEW